MSARARGTRRAGAPPWLAGGWRWIKWWLPLWALALLPVLTNWLANRYQVSAQDLIFPTILAALTAAVVAGTFYGSSRRDRLAALAAAVPATLVLASAVEGRLNDISPVFSALNPFQTVAGPAYAAAFAALVLWLAAWLGRAVSRLAMRLHWSERDFATGIVVAVAATFAFQFFAVAYDLAAEWPQFFYRPPKLAGAPAAMAASKPDIYYIVLEDYANNDVLKKQFSFDNDSFTDFLEQKGYSVDATAKANYPYTAMSVASALSGNYLNDLVARFHAARKQSVVPFNATTRNAPVAQALQSLGYQYSLIGNWYEAFNLSESANHAYEWNGLLTVMGHKFTLNNFSKLAGINSLFGRVLEMGIRIGSFQVLTYNNLGDMDLAHAQLGQLKALAAQPAGGRFIVADIMVPHEPPFVFNADGSQSANPNGDNVGEPLKQKYLGSVQYVNGQMRGILDTIDRNSGGKAVVVLLSDEGPQILSQGDSSDLSSAEDELQSGDMRTWSANNLALKYGALSAVKLPGADPSVVTPDNTSAVNIFRLVLNQYFGYGLPYLPNCYYAYPNGRDKPLMFTNITQQLTGQAADSRCLNDGTVSGS